MNAAATAALTVHLRTLHPHPRGVAPEQVVLTQELPTRRTGHDVLEIRLHEGVSVEIGRLVVRGPPRRSGPWIWIYSAYVSRHHCRLRVLGTALFAEDVGSIGGLLVGGGGLEPGCEYRERGGLERVLTGSPRRLARGDWLHLGAAVLVAEVPQSPE